jgi:hypothetical protein
MLTTIAIVLILIVLFLLINGPNKVVCNVLLAIATVLIFWSVIGPHL